MIQINKIILENFQSHKYSELEFDEGLNAIIGSTDSGKTAIFRALKWALYNEPQGDYFVREGEDYVSVKVFFDSGIVVNRYRKKNKNGYELTYPDGDVSVFEGFGVKVPKEIIEATKIRKVSFTATEARSLNMAEQLEGPFLLSDTPGTKAAAIGKLVEADVVDYALSQTNLDLRSKRNVLKASKENLEILRENLKDYEYLQDLEDTIQRLEEIQRVKEKAERSLQTLENINASYTYTSRRISDLESLLEGLAEIDVIERKYLETFERFSRLERLNSLNERLSKVQSDKTYQYNLIESLEGVDKAGKIAPDIDTLNRKLEVLSNISNRLKIIVDKQRQNENIFAQLKNLDLALKNESILREQIGKYNRFVKIFEDLNKLNLRISKGNGYIKEFKDIGKSELISDEIDIKNEKLKVLESKAIALKAIRNRIANEDIEIKKLESKLEKDTEEYFEYLKKEKKCPTCFKPIDGDDIQDILKHLRE